MYRLRKVGKKERVFLGVCGGISKYIDPELDPVIVRILWTIITFFAMPFMILLYFVLAVALKREDYVFKEKTE
jgi:phage shock protein C